MTTATVAAAIDIGTNSVKLTVGRRQNENNGGGNGGATEILHDAVAITRLGKGVGESGQLDDAAVRLTLAALTEFARQAQERGAERLAAVGTSALRDAGESGAAFVREATQILGGTVEIISGDREADLVYRSARQDADLHLSPQTAIAATDIGGGSTEIVLGSGDQISFRVSLQMGAVRLTERALPRDTPTPAELDHAVALADDALKAASVPVPVVPPVVVASGGTAASLAAMALMARPNPPVAITPDALHGARLTLAEIEARIDFLAALPLAARRETTGLEPDRADVIIAGAIIQARLLRHFGTDSMVVSARGLRYGLLYELLGNQ